MSTVARINAEINLKDNLSRPLSEAGTKVKKFADDSSRKLNDFAAKSRAAWKEFGEELQKVSQKAQMAGAALSIGVTAPIVALATKAVKAASDFNESFTKTEQVFGKASTSVVAFSNQSASALGLSKQAALDYASTFGLILQAGGKTEAQSAEMSLTLSKLSADLASFYNVDVSTAADKLKSGLVGEAEPLRAFGVLLSETAVKARALAMGFKEQGGQLSEAAKVQARYAIILDQTRKAQGDFGRTSDGLANSSRIMKAELADLSVEFGDILLPFVKEGVSKVRELMERFKALSPETKKTVVAIAAIAAAAGPVLLVLGTLGNAVSGLIAGWGSFAKVAGLLTKALSASGGILTVIRTAFTFLTGPIGLVIAALTALYLAWKTNFLGIRDILQPFVDNVRNMLSDVWENVKSTFSQIWPFIVNAWKSVVAFSKPVIDFYVKSLQRSWTIMANVVTVVFRFITDLMNTSMAAWKLIFGAGWEDLTNSMRASLLRMRALAINILMGISAFVVSTFQALTGWLTEVPGLGKFYDDLLAKLVDRVAALKAEGEATGWLADQYQNLADKQRKVELNKIGGGAGGGVAGLTRQGKMAPLYKFDAKADDGGGKSKVAKIKETEEERLKAQILEEILNLQKELNAEKAKAAGETLKDVLALQEYGKRYKDLTTTYRKAKIDAMAALETFKTEQDERNKLIEQEKERVEATTKARAELNRAVFDSASNLAKEREQLYYTTEFERARWEVTNGGYKQANILAKGLYLGQAKLLDQARTIKEVGEKVAAFWTDLIEKQKAWVKEQRDQANERYEEYIRDLTKELLKLRGAQDEIVRSELFEQFKGAGAGLPGLLGFYKVLSMVSKVMGDMKRNSDLEKKIAQIRQVAKAIEDIFKKSLDDLFENGFKNFFSSVVNGFRDLARQIAAEFLRIQLMKALLWGVGQLFGAGAKSDFSMALGARASGGSAFAGHPYVVGERGPEVFVPNVSGTVVPRDETGSRKGSGGPNIVVNLQVPNYSAFKKSEAQLAAQVFARAGRAREREGR